MSRYNRNRRRFIVTFWSGHITEGAGGIDRDGGVNVGNVGIKIGQKSFNNQQRLEAAMECRGGPQGGES